MAAGRDGFCLHRLLTVHGVANYVLEPTSILINRRARRAKTDRLDAEGMLRVLATYLRRDRQSCSMVRVPTPDEEDAKRIHRERERLVQERLRIENRIEALLFTQGIRKRPSASSVEARSFCPAHLRWTRDCRAPWGRIGPPASTARHDLGVNPRGRGRTRRGGRDRTRKHRTRLKIATLLCVRGLGENFSDVLTRVVFYRSFDNRRQIASYVGITPMPYQSGGNGPRSSH